MDLEVTWGPLCQPSDEESKDKKPRQSACQHAEACQHAVGMSTRRTVKSKGEGKGGYAVMSLSEAIDTKVVHDEVTHDEATYSTKYCALLQPLELL